MKSPISPVMLELPTEDSSQLPVEYAAALVDQADCTLTDASGCCRNKRNSKMSNPVVTSQPGVVHYGTNVQTGQWSTELCACHKDLLVCCIGWICPAALTCYTAHKYGEHCFLGILPGGNTALRTHMRLTYGIEGTVTGDALMICFCGLCEACRMAREVRIRIGLHEV